MAGSTEQTQLPAPPARPAAGAGGWLAALGVAALAALLYLPSVRNGYTYDDTVILRDNPVVSELGWREALLGPYWPRDIAPGTPNWRPLAMLSFLAERWVTGPRVPSAHHASNALLHGLVVLALYPLARRLAGRWAIAAVALFAAHPAHAEAVAPIVGRCDLIAALGAFLALECFLRYRDGGRAWWLALGAFAYALGLAGKEAAAPLILLLPVADVLLRGRPLRALAGREARAYLPFAAVLAFYLVARVEVLGEVSFRHAGELERGFAEHFLLAARNAVVSLGLLLFPVRFYHTVTTVLLSAPFNYPDPAGFAAAAYVAGGVAVALGWIALLRRAPRAAFLWLGALLMWLPTSGLLPAGAGASMRFLFLPTAFLACGLGMALRRAAVARPVLRLALAASVLVAAALGAALSMQRTAQWHDDGTFYESVLAEAPDCYAAHQNLGTWYADRRPPDLERAREHYREAVRVAGESECGFMSQVHLAATYEKNDSGGHFGSGAPLEEAERLYRQLIQTHPQRHEPHLLLAMVLDQRGRADEALEHFERVIALEPGAPGTELIILRCAEGRQRMGDARRAAAHYRLFLEQFPDHPRAAEARRRLEALAP